MQQFFVCQISNKLTLGSMDETSSLEESLALVRKVVQENGVELTQEVEDEIDTNYGYVDNDLQWSVQVGIVG